MNFRLLVISTIFLAPLVYCTTRYSSVYPRAPLSLPITQFRKHLISPVNHKALIPRASNQEENSNKRDASYGDLIDRLRREHEIALGYNLYGSKTVLQSSRVIMNLFDLISRGDLAAFKHIFMAYSSIIDLNYAKNDRGFTFLAVAASQGRREFCQFLVESGADVNMCTKNLESPLLLAIEQGHLNIARYLLDVGADPNLQSKMADSPLFVAIETGDEDGVRLLLNQPSINITITNNKNKTALHVAVDCEKPNIVAMLLEKGALVDAVDGNGRTPLFGAVANSGRRNTLLLIKAGANVNFLDKQGKTPLDIAQDMEAVDDWIVYLLTDNGADIGKHVRRLGRARERSVFDNVHDEKPWSFLDFLFGVRRF